MSVIIYFHAMVLKLFLGHLRLLVRTNHECLKRFFFIKFLKCFSYLKNVFFQTLSHRVIILNSEFGIVTHYTVTCSFKRNLVYKGNIPVSKGLVNVYSNVNVKGHVAVSVTRYTAACPFTQVMV